MSKAKTTPAAQKPAAAKHKTRSPFLTDDGEAAYQHFQPIAQTLAPGDLEAWNTEAVVVRANVQKAMKKLGPHLEDLATELPTLDLPSVLELPALAHALVFADGLVLAPASKKEILATQQRQRPARAVTLAQLEVFSNPEVGLLDPEVTRSTRKDSGPLDEARDGVRIVAVFNENRAKFAGQPPFSAEYLAILAKDSNWLQTQLQPAGVAPAKAEQDPKVLCRNQLFTEIVHRYEGLYLAGVKKWRRRGVDEHVPPLTSRQVPRAPKPAPNPPKPAP